MINLGIKKWSAKEYAFVILAFITLWGFTLRVWNLGEQSLWIDEGFTLNAANSVTEKGVPVLDSGKTYYHGFLSTYLVSAATSLFSNNPYNPWAARLPAVLFGTALIPLLFFLVRKLFESDLAALLAASLASFAYWEIAWARQARGYAVAAFFMLLVAHYLWKYSETRNLRCLFLSLFALGLTIGAQDVGLAIIPAYVFVVLILIFNIKKRRTQILWYGTAAIVLTMLAIYWLIPAYRSPETLMFFRYFTPELWILFGFMAGSIILVYVTRRYVDQITFLSALIIPTAAAIILFSPSTQVRYFVPLVALLLIYIVYIVYVAASALRSRKQLHMTYGVAFLACVPLLHLNFIPHANYYLEVGSPQPNFKEAFALIEKNKNPGDLIISPYAHMHKIYLGEAGLWLKMLYNGKVDRFERGIVDGADFFTGAPIVDDLSELKKIIESGQRHGFIVMDFLAMGRLREINMYLDTAPGVRTILSLDAQGRRGAWIKVYEF